MPSKMMDGVNTPLSLLCRNLMFHIVARSVYDPLTSSLDAQADAAFSVVVAYEDQETGQHARNVCDLLVESLGRECKFTSQMWRFDALRIPECRETAAKGAAKADLIVISSHGVGDLPGEVKAWIELWLRDKGDLLALVALFDRPRAPVSQDWPIQDYLAGVAARAQVEFFAEPDVWPGREPYQEQLALDLGPGGGAPALLPLPGVTTPDADIGHWGLNE